MSVSLHALIDEHRAEQADTHHNQRCGNHHSYTIGNIHRGNQFCEQSKVTLLDLTGESGTSNPTIRRDFLGDLSAQAAKILDNRM